MIALYCAKYAKNKGYKIAAFTRYIFEKLELRGYAAYSGTAAPFLKLYRLEGFKNTMEKELLERGLTDRLKKRLLLLNVIEKKGEKKTDPCSCLI